MVKISFIGMDNMRNVILNGFLETHGPKEMIFSAAHQDKMEATTVKTRVSHTYSNKECTEAVKYLVLVVKPQYLGAVFSEIKDVVTPERMVVSLAPGITISSIMGRLRGNVRAVRVMPNVPAVLGEGVTGVSCGEVSHTKEEKETIRDISSFCGRVELVEEQLINTVGCASGSSPASMCMFTEALADSGVKYGPSRKTACAVTAQTVLGNAKMILEMGKYPGQLKDGVCSPGGTTITGVPALEEYGPRNVVIKVVGTCHEKTWHMKQNDDVKS